MDWTVEEVVVVGSSFFFLPLADFAGEGVSAFLAALAEGSCVSSPLLVFLFVPSFSFSLGDEEGVRAQLKVNNFNLMLYHFPAHHSCTSFLHLSHVSVIDPMAHTVQGPSFFSGVEGAGACFDLWAGVLPCTSAAIV